MAKLKYYQAKQVDILLSRRPGETKFGEKITFIKSEEDLSQCPSKFVLFGIPEDIGVRANYGVAGTKDAWQACLKSLLNVQANAYTHPDQLLLLGEIDCTEELQKASLFEISDPNYLTKLGELVERIDEEVSRVVKMILSAGKIPIIIGGGHNNAYGNLKGASEALGGPVNVLNIDAHTDLRQLEHRHSGNGFSSAKFKGYLNRYGVFGLHPNYTPQYIFEALDASEEYQYFLFDDLQKADKYAEFVQAIEFVASGPFGLEIDCDAIAGFPSSAISPSGFSLEEVRGFVKLAANDKECIYLHLCEAAPGDTYPTGKALSFLITDFINLHTR